MVGVLSTRTIIKIKLDKHKQDLEQIHLDRTKEGYKLMLSANQILLDSNNKIINNKLVGLHKINNSKDRVSKLVG